MNNLVMTVILGLVCYVGFLALSDKNKMVDCKDKFHGQPVEYMQCMEAE